ncbi:hypothetical protein BDA96_03G311800 [Sorghum bicolor]|jgi:hypothetical protein|uniref:Uncharacterized protein n=2 Tax=Sorghum bicolor TaxID=4558 RepID=C5XJ58_SORBI|nr:hypothetical protein SORBI_3003G288700 [Sorghum bicolor]KAG0539305.1 hypothetical protein BDA96_03G311800 [Sorghum bicolor]
MDHTTPCALLPEVGSFSYSWPTSKPEPQPEERIVQGDITASSITADPASSSSPSQCSFDFRLSVSEQTEAMAVADQMFLDGLLLPLHLASQHAGHAGNNKQQPVLPRSLSLDSSQRMVASAATSKQHPPTTRPGSVSQNSSPFNLRGGHGSTVTTAGASGAMIRMTETKLRLPSFGRWRKQHRWISFRFLVPLYRKMVRCVWRGKATEEEAKDAPRRAGSAKAKLSDLGQESAIRDAILHCKRSSL